MRGPGGSRLGGWWATLAVALVAGLTYGAISLHNFFPHTYLQGDCPYYAAAAVSLIADGDLKIENNLKGGRDRHAGFVSLGADGEWRPKHPVLMSVTSIPFLLAFGVKGLLIFNLVVMTLLAAATHRLAIRGAAPLPATGAALITCLLTFVVAYAYNYSPDAFAALPAVVAVILFLDDRFTGSGLLVGVALLAKPVHLVLLLVGTVVAWSSAGPRSAGRFAAGALPAIALLMLYNIFLFGGPLTFGYDRMLEPEPGGVISNSQRADFSLEGAPGRLIGQIVDPRHGLLFTAPSTLFAIVGLGRLWRRRPRMALLPAALGPKRAPALNSR